MTETQPRPGDRGWYRKSAIGPLGPYSEADLRALYLSGELRPSHRVKGPDVPQWQKASTIPALQGVLAPVARLREPAPPAAPRGSYILKHWRGEVSLGIAFWVNCVILSLAIRLLLYIVGSFVAANDAVRLSFAVLLVMWPVLLAVVVWQIVGTWRSADHYVERTGRRHSATSVRLALVLNIVGSVFIVITQAVPQMRVAIDLLSGDREFADHELNLLRDGTELEFAGGISFGLTDEIRKTLDAAPQVRVIHLNSRGGRLGEARSLRDLIRERGLITYTASQCASACTVAFMGGRERYVAPTARLGFHQGALPGFEAQVHSENAVDKAALIAAGVSPAFAERAYTTANDDIWYPGIDELQRAYVITGVAAVGQFAVSGLGRDLSQGVEEKLLTYPAFVALRKRDPAAFDTTRDDLVAAKRKGADFDAAFEFHESALRAKYLPLGSDAAAVEMFAVVADITEQMNRRDPLACRATVVGLPGKRSPLLDQQRERATEERRQAALAHLVESAQNAPHPVPDKAQLRALLAPVFQRIAERYPRDVLALSHPTAPEVDPAHVCDVLIAYYREILALPPEQSAAVIRSIDAQP